MTGNEIREKFLSYFEKHGHKRVASSPLLPANDPTLLFANAGMNQFKDTFLGAEKRDYARAASSQKCLRAGGKHNDLDDVGDATHHTFFEMLGNFSFGDYFKREAIEFALDLLLNEYKIPLERLWFTVYETDDEAAQLWEEAGVPRERILRFGAKDNFWQMGDTGPCGPCSEIHYYKGENPNDAEFNRLEYVNRDGSPTVEIWNLVFMQYDRDAEGTLTPLPKPSVDTGAGLERVTAVLQDAPNNYETDLLRPIVDFVARLADRHYESETKEGHAMRVITDHARATAFAIADNILPGNEGRNYVLRKIMRRAIYHGRHALQLNDLFFHRVSDFVVDMMREAYPELEASRDFISRIVKLEEERFGSTLATGLKKLETITIEVSITKEDREFFGWKLEDEGWDAEKKVFVLGKANPNPSRNKIEWISLEGTTKIIGANVIKPDGTVTYVPREQFPPTAENQASNEIEPRIWAASQHTGPSLDLNKLIESLVPLYDTFGTPRDLIRVKLEELGVHVEEEIFNEIFDEGLKKLQQQASSEDRPTHKAKTNPVYAQIAERVGATEFTGYDETRTDNARIVALLRGETEVEELSEGEVGEVVLDRTPFYAESGGQVGDTGTIVTGGASATVLDTPTAPAAGLVVHRVKVERGRLRLLDQVTAVVDVEKRDATRRNHTATHLMHAALREVLGMHVKQAGSVVAPNYLRFDFSHYQPLTRDEIAEIERLVNYHVLRNEPVRTEIVPLEQAMQTGAMALFGEKYAERVRVLTVPGAEGVFSKELCGGTHVRATGDIGMFKITSDESIASGTRRIRAVTGRDAFNRFQETEALVDQISSELRATRGDISAAVNKLQEDLKRARREADELRMKLALGAGASARGGEEAREVAGGVKVVAREASDLDAQALRQLSDTMLAQIKSGVVVLGRRADGKASLIVRTSADLSKRVPAGQVIKELAPIIGGRGGGKPDMAEGGGPETQKLSEALEASYQVVERLLGEQGAAA
ncbi:MAG TPA: alanine--tRNA ligase [Pyrinomonadaceae bacterium]|nr:alanine--tRNA ligase [Pyrinomonadaceae bacterium]